MGEIVSYSPLSKQYTFNPESLWIETLWATMYANNVSETAKIVFATIVMYVREEPLYFPSQKELAEAVNKSVPTIERSIRELKERKLISTPEKSGRFNRYRVNDHFSADLKFSERAEIFLKTLLSVKVSILDVTPIKSDGHKHKEEIRPIKNDGYEQEKEKEKKEERKERTKEKKEEIKEKEREVGGETAHIPSHLNPMERRQYILDLKRRKNKARETLKDTPKTVTSAQKLPKSVSKWTTTHFERYFAKRYHELSGKELPKQFEKNRTLLKKTLERGIDRIEMKEVIDFVFDEWEELQKRLKLEEGLPSIGFVFSGYFDRLLNLKRAGFSAHKFKDLRSDFEFDLDLSKKEFKG